MPKISVVVPCYNQAIYLDECLQSVVDQSFQDWECIIVDDGSPDNTERITAKWLEKDTRFRYFKKENEGVSIARNYGIENATGEWILPLDGDDKISTDYLQKASAHFTNNHIIITADAEYFGAKEGKAIVAEFNMLKMLAENQIFCASFFRKKDWLLVGKFDGNFKNGYEDWDFWLKFIDYFEDKFTIKKLNITGLFYRIKENSRNTDAMLNNDLFLRQQLYDNHETLYKKWAPGIIAQLNTENHRLRKRNDYLEKFFSSKKNRLMLKLFKLIGI